MAIKSKTNLTIGNNNAITDSLNKQNTAARVRNDIQDVIDSSLNVIDILSGSVSMNHLYTEDLNIIDSVVTGQATIGTNSINSFCCGINSYITDSPYSFNLGGYFTGTPERSVIAHSPYSFSLGNDNNIINSEHSFIQGYFNTLTNSSIYSHILGGGCYVNNSVHSTISGDAHTLYNSDFNIISGQAHTLTGSNYNNISGYNNDIDSSEESLVAGSENILYDSYDSCIIGSQNSMTSSIHSYQFGLNHMNDGFSNTFQSGKSTIISSQGEYARNNLAFNTQYGTIQMGETTTSATPARLYTDGGVSGNLSIPSNSSYQINIRVLGTKTDGDSVSYEANGIIKNVAGTTTLVSTITPTQIQTDASLSTTAVSVTADNTNDALNITVTGLTATNIYWHAVIDYIKIKFI